MSARSRRTGLVWHERFMWHDTGASLGVVSTGVGPFPGQFQPSPHAEHPETKRRLKNLLDARDVTPELTPIQPFEADDEPSDLFDTETDDTPRQALQRLSQSSNAALWERLQSRIADTESAACVACSRPHADH